MPFLPDDFVPGLSRQHSKSVVKEDYHFYNQEQRIPSHMPLSDPNQHPDLSYAYRLPYSSSKIQGHRHTASSAAYPDHSGDEDSTANDSHVYILPPDSPRPPSLRGQPPLPRAQDSSRWSASYSAGDARSRSSSFGNGYTDVSHPPPLSQKPSYDISWQTVDEKDELAISEEETDDEQGLDNVDDDDADGKDDPEPTSAALVAEEGRGLIIQGDSAPVFQIQIQPGTTHLLIGSSTTPNSVPLFLTSTLPQIARSLLALDISANFLGALPPVLAVCENLEELNVGSNPLRVLPVFLADLLNLRVLIADSTGITTLPDTLVDLDKLHTISIRRNKLHALPSWLCLLPALQTLCVDGNPFQGPWRALVDPLLAKVPSTPVYPPSTPVMPSSPSLQSSQSGHIPQVEVDDEFSDQETSNLSPAAQLQYSAEDEDQTMTIERSLLGRAKTSPSEHAAQPTSQPSAKPLARTRTTPNRNYYDQNRAKSTAGLPSESRGGHQSGMGRNDDTLGKSGGSEIRKMKSAGDLRRTRPGIANAAAEINAMPQRPPLLPHAGSLSSSNLLNSMAGSNGSEIHSSSQAESPYPKRFASLGPSSQLTQKPPVPPLARPVTSGGRPQLSQSMWEQSGGVGESGQFLRSLSNGTPGRPRPPSIEPKTDPLRMEDLKVTQKQRSRWGFFKKMSMGKIKPDSPTIPSSGSPNPTRVSRPTTVTGGSPPKLTSSVRGIDRLSKTPQIDLRFSTTGALDAFPAITASQSHPPSPEKPPFLVEKPPVPSSNGLLAAPAPPVRSAKRRSFLPIDAPGQILSIPENSKFVSGVVVSPDADDQQAQPSPNSVRGGLTLSGAVVGHEVLRRKEEERAREAYMRALRSVMAYLKDMNDLSHVQQSNPLSMYGVSSDEHPHPRSRRPTVVESQFSRESSMTSSGGSTTDSSSHLRSAESIAGMRSGSSSQTLSVMTTDSSGSQEERKFKDDKGKRAMVIREIVVTERTYVKGLQELVDIYIQPACAPVNLLSGSKDTVVPAPERKVVFGGIESLFSFHKDSFLPALEVAAAPVMKPAAELQELDIDGQLSLNVAKAVGSMFVKHAAFMKMYSSYINNFDSSVQRVKYWTSSDKYASAGNSSPGNALTPSSSNAHLVGLGISMAMSGAPNALSESLSTSTGIPNLSTSQRKRIKSYLKRCRLNPRHTQLNLEGYLLLPVQRIPRYKLLLEELVRSTPPPLYEYLDDPLDRALSEITALASNMNEGKRDAESRRKLVRWQSRIRGKFPSPLVQPHRRLIMDGPLLLTRVVRKAVVSFEAINAQGDMSTVQVDCLAPELTPRPLIGILCNDLLVLCRDPSEGQDPSSPVDLWAVLRMQILPQPASIVHGNALRLVDNKAVLYFEVPSASDALNWYRAINLHIPASKA